MAETTGIIYKSKLTAIGDAIRERTGETGLINIDAMPEKILGIKGGVDNPLIAENDAQMEEYLNNADYLGMFVKFTGNSSNYVTNEIYRIEENAGDIEQYMPVSELQNITTVKKLLDATTSAERLFYRI